jgi:hypothetical protein
MEGSGGPEWAWVETVAGVSARWGIRDGGMTGCENVLFCCTCLCEIRRVVR